MKINTAKRLLLEGKPAIGAGAVLGSPIAAELMSQSGYDWIIVDCQHGDWEDDGALQAFRAISLGGAVPMARVRQNDYGAIGRLLDRGALGIIVPMINNAAEARAAVYAARYAPLGGRSWGPFLAGYHGPDYGAWAEAEIWLAVQIETVQGVENAEAIMATEGIDGCWIGPKDLARSMGVDINTPAGRQAHEDAILKVLAACRKTGKVPGIDAKAGGGTQRWLDHGFLFVTTTSDADLLLAGSETVLKELRQKA
ncbi:MAG: aldolase/citrate lyase family protein [Anaerolineales bacterium]